MITDTILKITEYELLQDRTKKALDRIVEISKKRATEEIPKETTEEKKKQKAQEILKDFENARKEILKSFEKQLKHIEKTSYKMKE